MAFSQLSRTDIAHEILIWVEARNRSTNAVETMGLWTGLDVRSFDPEGTGDRLYFGAGAVIEVPPLEFVTGVTVQQQRVRLGILTPEVEQLVREYDMRQAPVEIHVARQNPLSDSTLGYDRLFRGFVDGAPLSEPEQGGNASLDVVLVSQMRSLTETRPDRVSDEAHRRAYPGDRWLRYADVSGVVPVFWGQRKQR